MATYRVPVQLDWTGAPGGPGVNVWHLRNLESTPGAIETLLSYLADFYSGIAGALATDVTVTCPDYITTVGEDPTYYAIDDPFTIDGSGSGGFAPMPTAMTITWYSENATRSGRGRTFVGPLMGDAVDGNGTPTGDIVALLESEASDFVDSFGGFDVGAFVVYSPTDSLARDIVRSNVRDTFATLRSRRD